ncbi:hypothetical protein LOK49_LG08G00056 [Camellia lanceoleosa]|uniref:Uncharacterized protein n=1 Tax=Camellia lanceoleosa TaxID=1840588 RepID=A0ACC0GP18_9ERIC|nr:hypothetical protein LOK49_LG08G00056 [Camellia lanceoleosa]
MSSLRVKVLLVTLMARQAYNVLEKKRHSSTEIDPNQACEDTLQEMADIMLVKAAKALVNQQRTAKVMWERAEEFIKQEPNNIAMRAAIRDNSKIVLIVAVKSKQRNYFVKKLVNRMSPEDLAQGDREKRIALHRAAAVGNIEAAKLLVEKNW